MDIQQSYISPRQASFLRLPRELRDNIYSFLLDDTRAPPESPDHVKDRLCPPGWRAPCAIYFERQSPKPALLQLKLCSSQIYAEVTDLLSTQAKEDEAPVQLDLMVKGSSIWPTWTSLPTSKRLDPVITINFRLFESKGWGSEFSTVAYRGLWSLINLLVSHGPCLIHNTVGLSQQLCIAQLEFEISFCYPTSVDDLFGTYRDVFDRFERLAYDNVGLGNVKSIQASMGSESELWRVKQLPSCITLPIWIK